MAERITTGRFQGELSYRRVDGTTFPGDVSSVIYHTPYGTRISITIRDITERYRLEAEVRQAKQRQRAILNSIPDQVWLKDSDGHYIVVNPAFAAFYQTTPDRFIDQTAAHFNAEPIALQVFHATMQRCSPLVRRNGLRLNFRVS